MYKEIFLKNVIKGVGQTTGALLLTGLLTGIYFLSINFFKSIENNVVEENIEKEELKEEFDMEEVHNDNHSEHLLELTDSELFLANNEKYKMLFENH
jgi:hypothetical protein